MVPHGFLNGVIHRDTMDLLATFSRRYSCHNTPSTNLLCIGIHQANVELPLFSRGALHKNTGLLITVDHAATSTAFFTTRSIVSSISYPFSASIALPSASLVPASLTITFWGISAAIIPFATSSHFVIPPSRFTTITFTDGTLPTSLTACITRSLSAPPPTSRKFA